MPFCEIVATDVDVYTTWHTATKSSTAARRTICQGPQLETVHEYVESDKCVRIVFLVYRKLWFILKFGTM